MISVVTQYLLKANLALTCPEDLASISIKMEGFLEKKIMDEDGRA